MKKRESNDLVLVNKISKKFLHLINKIKENFISFNKLEKFYYYNFFNKYILNCVHLIELDPTLDIIIIKLVKNQHFLVDLRFSAYSTSLVFG